MTFLKNPIFDKTDQFLYPMRFQFSFIVVFCILLTVTSTAQNEFYDDFTNGNANSWPVGEETGIAIRTINDSSFRIASLKSGSYPYTVIPVDLNLTKDFESSAAINYQSVDNQASGLLFGYLDGNNFQSFVMSKNGYFRYGVKENEISLLIGSTPEDQKEQIRKKLSQGEIKLVIGTHALLQEPVEFQNLQLAIVDEQHRFGVEQRGTLRKKGNNPHLLVMTATPIPRSLALTTFGDLELSVIDELPPGRLPVETHVLFPREIERAYSLVRRQADKGNQAFIIYPLVEESEKIDEKAAVEEFTRLQKEIFPSYSLGLLHGQMRPNDKESVMTLFRDKEIQILVSTSVVEVGVDIPGATVMLVEGAHRFGLAQLHQFRGRVGRSDQKSYCILIPGSAEEVENQRLQAMVETNDGFVLAEKDLEIRGPGQFLGTRQSGYTELKLASITDLKLVEQARQHASELFRQDPELSQENHQKLALAVNQFWTLKNSGDIS